MNTSSKTNSPLKYKKKSLLIIIIAGILIAIASLIGIMFAGGTVNKATVRLAWDNSPLANSPYFKVEKVETISENTLSIRVKGIEPNVIYSCETSGGGLSKNCWIKVEGISNNKQFGLSEYFWDLHKNEIQSLLAKYGKSLNKWTDVQIDVYNSDAGSATAFVQDLLKIPDMQRLYSAYKVEATRTNATEAYVAFGNYWLDFYSGNSNKGSKLARYSLFEWASKQGI